MFLLLIIFIPLGAFWTLIFTTIALLISALVEAARQNLSLYNAILISYLCILHSVITVAVMVWGLYQMISTMRFRRALLFKMLGMNIATIIQMVSSAIFGLYIWSRVETFGNQPECNPDTLLILAGKSHSATSSHARSTAIGESNHEQSPLPAEFEHLHQFFYRCFFCRLYCSCTYWLLCHSSPLL